MMFTDKYLLGIFILFILSFLTITDNAEIKVFKVNYYVTKFRIKNLSCLPKLQLDDKENAAEKFWKSCAC